MGHSIVKRTNVREQWEPGTLNERTFANSGNLERYTNERSRTVETLNAIRTNVRADRAVATGDPEQPQRPELEP